MSKNTNLSFLTDYITADITNGRIGINNASPTVAFDVTGVAKFSSSVSATSYNATTQNIFAVDGSEKMRITSTSLIGIGTTSPDYAITISGSTEATSGIRIKNTDGVTSNSRLIIEQANGQSMNMYSAGNGFTFNYNLTGGIAFYDGVASANRFAINGSGNVGIGISPSAWASGFRALQLASSTAIWSGTGTGGGSYFTNNVFFDGARKYINSAFATEYQQSSGVHYFQVAPSGTAGNTISFTTAMQITSSGFCYLGDGFGNSNHRINRKVAQGGIVLVVSGYDSTANDTTYFYSCSGASGNGAATAMMVTRNDSTNRSINAGGTVNASGSDYAEYMTKSVNDIINKGDIVGVDINGKLTNLFSDSISFVIKSTDPSYVGGDVWGNEDTIGKRPLKTEDQSEEEFAIIMEAFEIKLEKERAKVDRVAFSGQVPCNILEANVGDYIIPINDNGKIKGQAISNPTFEQYQNSVGKVWKIMEDGRAWVAVKIG